jgi:hypothetical protein
VSTNSNNEPPKSATSGKYAVAGSATIELYRITRKDIGCFFAEFGDRERKWRIEIRPEDLQVFAKFQLAVVKQLGLLVRHACESGRSQLLRNDIWASAIGAAFDAGVPQ